MLCPTPKVRDQFYEALDETIFRNPKTEGLYLLGDFNTRVGAYCDTCPSCLGCQGIGRMNENGQWLLELGCHHGHPRSRHWHQLDLVLTRHANLRSVLHTRSFHSAYCNTDHSLVGCNVRLRAKKIHCSKTKGLPRINTCCSNDPESSRHFQTTFSTQVDTSSFSATDIDSRCHHLLHAIYISALTAFRKKDRQNADWYKAHWDEMQPASEARSHFWPTSKTLVSIPAMPSELLAARLNRLHATAPTTTGRTCAAGSRWLPTVETQEACTLASKLPPVTLPSRLLC
ncbi:unnamed protein product [Acanthosepion pharaonis]|uniref:Uncharacterized protein n=1 Tax=Acanthosepion pharaonis TaxID=158019 RepID=A0A812CYC5_ACAPH|nr:unnamed protein product [Sepia pharaonis]